ncbi:MAG: FecR domain-containing protein [Bacteroides sp.]|nr:FecR domain-containing protein [Prevotella sp.]MCM1408271.1 FecR domain-containing protein [Treponema brennaborense]MCM1470497.1 FecR domain-containing protein [Bacteroides sp.]
MRKKTKSKLSNNTAGFLIAVILCLIGAGFCSYLFYENLTRTFSKLGETPVAVISFKRKAAQRKFLGRVLWDRLRNESPLYNGDTVHTAPSGEATIVFADGNTLTLLESTMAQIFADEENGSGAQLSSGGALIDASSSSGGFTFASGGVSVNVGSGARLSVSSAAADSAVALQVLAGNASVHGIDGAEHAVSAGEEIEISESGAVSVPEFSVLFPSRDEKILYHTEEDSVSVGFSVRARNIAEDSELVFEVSDTKKFADISRSAAVQREKETPLPFAPGTHYWRVRDASAEKDAVLASGKLQVIQSPAPQLVVPAESFCYQYRTKTPAVRFVWSPSEKASAYRLVVADNRELQNPVVDERVFSESASVSTLAGGVYYWQVTPYYAVNRIGYAAPSEIRSFEIQRGGELPAPQPLLPAHGETLDLEKRGRFSWKGDREASSFLLTLSQNEDLSSPALTIETADNFYAAADDSRLREVSYWWSVQAVDGEGNTSPASAPRVCHVVRGKIEQRTVEPADGYQIEENLVRDMLFTWKKNLPADFESVIEVSQDSAFESIAAQFAANGYSYKGLSLPAGTYYYRMKSAAADGSRVLLTEPKSFSVVRQLGRTEVLSPQRIAVSWEAHPFLFRWTAVDGAEFYKVTLYRADDNSVVFSENVKTTETAVNLFGGREFADRGMYRLEIQPRTSAVSGVSNQRTGVTAESEFMLRKARPVSLLLPKKDAKIDEFAAYLNGIDIRWNSAEKTSGTRVEIYKDSADRGAPIYTYPPNSRRGQSMNAGVQTISALPSAPLTSGRYEIVVRAAAAEDGIDLSNTEYALRGRFTITPYKKFAVPRRLSASPECVNAAYLSGLKANETPAVVLSWNDVPSAKEYRVTIAAQSGGAANRFETTTSATSLVIDLTKDAWQFLLKENKADFVWTVEARAAERSRSGRTRVRDGNIASSTFGIDIPAVNSADIELEAVKEIW